MKGTKHTFRPKNTTSYSAIWHALRRRGYEVSYGKYKKGPHILLVHPMTKDSTAFWPLWVKTIVWECNEADSFPPEWWEFAKQYRGHLLFLHEHVGMAAVRDLVDWLAGPENLVRPELPWRV